MPEMHDSGIELRMHATGRKVVTKRHVACHPSKKARNA